MKNMKKRLSVTQENLNYSVSAYRVLYILLLLVQNRTLSLAGLNVKLLENPLINRAYNSETITKYINTLRQAGCQIPRANSQTHFQYKLLKNPFPVDFSSEELEAANRLLTLLASFSDEDLHIRYYQILQKVAWTVLDEERVQQLFGDSSMLIEGKYRESRELLTRYRELCKDAQVLELDYQITPDERVTLQVEPTRVTQDGKKLYLIGLDRQNLKRVTLRLDSIRLVRQLPFKVQHKPKMVNVVFALTGRLAKTYRLFPQETEVAREDGRRAIKARTDDYPSLLLRLLRYGHSCEVLSPAYAREEMTERVDALLSVYVSEASVGVGREDKVSTE